MQCTHCDTAYREGVRSVASISGSMLGDEWTETWFQCPSCGAYSVEVTCEPFCGEANASLQGPIENSRAKTQIALIQQCPTPWDKKCRCQAHLSYFDGNLD